MSSPHFASRYSGSRVLPFARAPGTCHSCGQPSGDCRCGCRQCRKEAKELLLTADAKAARGQNATVGSLVGASLNTNTTAAAAAGTAATPTAPTAFIGGGCCVHISVEWAPISPTAQSMVAIIVKDSEGTLLAWEKIDPAGTHYQVKENVVTTKPGATITLFAINATARARWCEVFSC